jgi:hypothetical protein
MDFNLLQGGTWILEKKGYQKVHYFEKEVEGGKIVIYNALDLPTPFDSKTLDYLMLRSQENDWSQEVVLPSVSTILKELGLRKEKRVVERIKRSLRILKNTHIEFHNCFIDNGVLEHFEEGEWEIISIGIINDYGLLPVRGRGNPVRVKVIFDKNFISVCKYSLGYKLIPYAPIQGLRDTAYALYKWAWRWYDSGKGYGERWIGHRKKLVEWYKNELNSIAQYKYPSEVLRRVRSAIKQLNKNPEVPFYLNLKEEDGNYKIEIYRKELCTLKREIPFDKLPYLLRRALIRLIEQKKHIQEPYALARAMSLKEIENELKKVVLIPIPEDTWSTFQMLLEATKNEAEKQEIEQTILATDRKDSEVLVAVLKSKLKKGAFFKWLDSLLPNWRTFLQEAVGLLNEEKVLAK